MDNSLIKTKQTTEENTAINKAIKVAVAQGDGIGPEIMNATLKILRKANANIEVHPITIGKSTFEKGFQSGIDDEAWNTIHQCKTILKAPITTPQGKGYKSLNVTLRKSLGLYSNLRPVNTLSPFIKSNHNKMDVIIVRENEEDLYAGIEHRQTNEVYQCLKLISRPGCEKIIRFAFEYAKAYGRKKVTCMLKDNIMKLTDGLFHQVFLEIASEYPEIEKNVEIIDIGSAKLAAHPENYDVIVTSNLYGDIISDIAAEIAGSVGIAGSANIGSEYTMFEAIHGSAPDIAGKGKANPSGLINAAIQMLAYHGQKETADLIKNAWLCTIEQGIHTFDIYSDRSKQLVSTDEFAEAVISNLGKSPELLTKSTLSDSNDSMNFKEIKRPSSEKTLVGVDVFIDNNKLRANELGKQLSAINSETLKLKMITNRGVQVYPKGHDATFCTDHWRCRFTNKQSTSDTGYLKISKDAVINLQSLINEAGLDCIKTENLYLFDGEAAFSLGQGE